MSKMEQDTFFDTPTYQDMDVLTLIRDVLLHTSVYRCERLLPSAYTQGAVVQDWLLPFRIVDIEGTQDIAIEFAPLNIEKKDGEVIISNGGDSSYYDGFITPERMILELVVYPNDTVVKFRVHNDDEQSYVTHKDYSITGVHTVPIVQDGVEFWSLKFETV